MSLESRIVAALEAIGVDMGALQSEIAAARGDRSSLGLRISTVSNFASPNAGGVIVGQYYDNAFQAAGAQTLTITGNSIFLVPYYTSQRLRIDEIGFAVSTSATAMFAKMLIYESGPDNWPSSLVLESDEISLSGTGFKSAAVDVTFDAGRQYWIGVHTSANVVIRAINVSSGVNLGLSSSTGTNYYTNIRKSQAYASGALNPLGFLGSDLFTGNIPGIRFRAAAL